MKRSNGSTATDEALRAYWRNYRRLRRARGLDRLVRVPGGVTTERAAAVWRER